MSFDDNNRTFQSKKKVFFLSHKCLWQFIEQYSSLLNVIKCSNLESKWIYGFFQQQKIQTIFIL